MKTSAKNVAHIFRPFWLFELTHIVFELGHLNTINILNAPTIFDLVEGLWNNSFSAHNYFSEFLKAIWFEKPN